jgi:hypothetical protein
MQGRIKVKTMELLDDFRRRIMYPVLHQTGRSAPGLSCREKSKRATNGGGVNTRGGGEGLLRGGTRIGAVRQVVSGRVVR